MENAVEPILILSMLKCIEAIRAYFYSFHYIGCPAGAYCFYDISLKMAILLLTGLRDICQAINQHFQLRFLFFCLGLVEGQITQLLSGR